MSKEKRRKGETKLRVQRRKREKEEKAKWLKEESCKRGNKLRV
jgi:hypothetical protein